MISCLFWFESQFRKQDWIKFEFWSFALFLFYFFKTENNFYWLHFTRGLPI